MVLAKERRNNEVKGVSDKYSAGRRVDIDEGNRQVCRRHVQTRVSLWYFQRE